MLAIFCVVIVLLSVYFMLGCSNHHEIKEVGRKVDNIDDKISLCREMIGAKYPMEAKNEDAVVVDNPAVATAMDGTVTIETLVNMEDTLPEPKKRKPRKKTRTCENCANFVPIKEPKKRSTKKKGVLDEQKTKEETNQENGL